MTSGAMAATPYRPSPSPRRSAGNSSAVRVLVSTVLRPNPKPRTTLTVTMLASAPPGNNARAGTPSRRNPTVSSVRCPKRFISVGAASSAATVPSRSIAVTSPAPALLAPASDAYRGITEKGREKLVSAQNSARNTTTSGPLTRRSAGALRPAAWASGFVPACGSVDVDVLITATVRAKWITDKVQSYGDPVVRFEPGAACAARPRQRAGPANPAGSGTARRDPKRPA